MKQADIVYDRSAWRALVKGSWVVLPRDEPRSWRDATANNTSLLWRASTLNVRCYAADLKGTKEYFLSSVLMRTKPRFGTLVKKEIQIKKFKVVCAGFLDFHLS